MPIKSSGVITIQDIINEFGGSTPHSLSEYYRGGSNVPNKSQNNAIPLAGSGDAIALGDFYNATNIVTLSYTTFGGGGAGGSGFENDTDPTTRAGSGGGSGIMSKTSFDALTNAQRKNPASSNFLTKIGGGRSRVDGGVGGISGAFDTANATAGEATSFGDGGAAGARNNAGGSAPWGNWGAAGGGGGGDQGNGDSYEFFGLFNRGGADQWGQAGAGGTATATADTTGSVDLIPLTKYMIVLGHGGFPATSVGQHDGGYGNPGHFSFTLDTTGSNVYNQAPSGGGSNADRYKTTYIEMTLSQAGAATFASQILTY